MKIDIFCHISPQNYRSELLKIKSKVPASTLSSQEALGSLHDLDLRFKIMDQFKGLVQVLTTTGPPFESIADPADALRLSRAVNDGMAELVNKHPDRFIGAVARLPMNDIDAALKETDRAIRDLKFCGIMLHTDVDGKPLDLPELRPIYEKMCEYDLPIWIHPITPTNLYDYIGEDKPKYLAQHVFGWPYRTTLAMNRLVYSGIMEDFPALKIIVHHCGGMVPHFSERIIGMYEYNRDLYEGRVFTRKLKKHPIEYFRQFYTDTVTWGSIPALMDGYSFFGPDRVLFGTDMPYDGELGLRQTRDTIYAVENMKISAADKIKIFENNAKRLLRL